ncbi:flavin reductase (DIM6/NTAB) family NADH-FMN oxidoreductase RutF [Thermocatellispora tengchongensis]|uniref:Flavin reductase (DIM6/NTAB) family NADH-FMN oxidoreductase RutF n=1 Tax=Thermocatellispora tengchongensis TaxID=1073253 RepID=A0A840PHZ5_9ACTN|nr:flavin reductase family protein [Thermocatellispora tengchongensis]MBB5135695.1 flavin reductase (DIM6/NTAB) family NADH-FMN oxidoreductase RutF [Thermocatellispora tengchongensis]
MGMPPAGPRSAPVDSALLREVMRRFATGVAIVATLDRGTPYAASVNSLTSVSLEPPLILVCLKIGSHTCAAIQRAGRFSVSVLAEQHEEHSRRFAGSQPAVDDPAFEPVDGLPVIRDALAGMICEVESTQRKGDHVIVIGQVVRTHHEHDTPLLFFNSGYHRLAPAEPA